jgi:hypothetical protein
MMIFLPVIYSSLTPVLDAKFCADAEQLLVWYTRICRKSLSPGRHVLGLVEIE